MNEFNDAGMSPVICCKWTKSPGTMQEFLSVCFSDAMRRVLVEWKLLTHCRIGTSGRNAKAFTLPPSCKMFELLSLHDLTDHEVRSGIL